MESTSPSGAFHSISAVAGRKTQENTRSEAVITWGALSSLLLPGIDPAASGRLDGAAMAMFSVCCSAASPTRSPPPRRAIKSCTLGVSRRRVSKLDCHKHAWAWRKGIRLNLLHIYISRPHRLCVEDLIHQGSILRAVLTLVKDASILAHGLDVQVFDRRNHLQQAHRISRLHTL